MAKISSPALAPSSTLPLFTTAEEAVDVLRPARPLYTLRPDKVEATARRFMRAFPGDAMFAVKTNPDRTVLRALSKAGMRSFDVASIEEVRLVRRTLPKAQIFFMHPVKSPEAIREAYAMHGVRSFVLDSEEELFKILRETGLAPDLNLFIRLALPRNKSASIDFSAKFGCPPREAVRLLRKCRSVAKEIGLCFHVGTQTLTPQSYARAVWTAENVVRKAGVKLDWLDVGGGFPVSYPGSEAPQPEECIAALTDALADSILADIPLLAEPGRILVAEAGSLVVRVELRKGQTLYINDGTYGGLFDAGPALRGRFPVRAMRPGGIFTGEERGFRFAGPTCDSLDMMRGPFMLPSDIKMGDWIEIGNLGAYSQSMRTDFNGFGGADMICLAPAQQQ